ncbi:MAG: hypothetical protein ACK56F_25360, partial [bacterium]
SELLSDVNSSASIIKSSSTKQKVILTEISKNNKTINYFKFCAICGHKLRSGIRSLNSHFAAQHQING